LIFFVFDILKVGHLMAENEAVKRFEQIRMKLEKQEVAGFLPLGQSFQIAPAA
jgi:hypothetical protein